jgi:hypothetical protein
MLEGKGIKKNYWLSRSEKATTWLKDMSKSDNSQDLKYFIQLPKS